MPIGGGPGPLTLPAGLGGGVPTALPVLNGGFPGVLAPLPRTLDMEPDRYRPPVWRRTGAYDRLLARMLEQLPRQAIPDGPNAGRTPLARVNLEAHDDLIGALVRAWASVTDLLLFYQERIAQEGYLRTAVEERSVFELARLVGYSADPGLAAGTYLAFTIAESRGISDLVVPTGTRVQSIPSPGERPQPFETVEALPVRAEWNAMRAAPPAALVSQRVEARTRELRLDGTPARLMPGEPLLIVDGGLGAPDDPRRWRVVTLREVEHRTRAVPSGRPGPLARPRPERVVWDPPEEPPDAAPYPSPALYAFREQAHLFGWDAAEWEALSDRERERHARPTGGVACSSDGGATWHGPTGDPPRGEVQALAVDTLGNVIAGTDGRGIYRSSDGGATWRQGNTGLTRRDVRALAVDPSGKLLAGTVGGVYRSGDGGASWEMVHGDMRLRLGRGGVGLANTRLPNVAVRAVGLYLHPRDQRTYMLAGTEVGLFRSRAAAEGWQPANQGLPLAGGGADAVAVHAIAVHEDSGCIYVGTEQGVYYSRDAGERWIAVSDGLPLIEGRTGLAPTPVRALVAYTDRFGTDTYIVAATDSGLFYAIDPDTSWSPVGEAQLGGAHVSSLAVWFDEAHHRTEMLAGTDRGVLRSLDHGVTWAPVGALDGQVHAVAAGGGWVAAAAPVGPPAATDWPGFGVAGDELDLDATYLGIDVGSWLLLRQPRPHAPPLLGLYPVLETQRVLRSDFGRRRVVTRVLTRADERLGKFNRRLTTVHGRPLPLPLVAARDPSLTGREVTLAAGLSRPLEPGRTAIVTGKRMRARVARREGLRLRDDNGRLVAEPRFDEVLELLEPPELLDDGRRRFRLREGNGAQGWVDLGPDDLAPEAAADDDPTTSEVATIAATVLDDGRGRSGLLLADPLANVYDGNTVVVSGNVAYATHGETVASEVLGSGDYQLANQRFMLRRGPLTWLADPRTGRPTSTLTVYVNRVRWHLVDSLRDAGPSDHVYALERDETGNTWVVFGDGVMGARLPGGFENVVATYRSGLGLTGEVHAESLVQLMTRPLGLRSAVNPLPATGAAAPERPEDVRERAPLHARSLRRIVSLEDYVDFARTYPGVAKVDARLLWDGREQLVHLTVATEGDDDEGIRAELARAIAAARAGARRVQVDGCGRDQFEVAAVLWAEPGRLPDDLEQQASAVLARAYGFAARRLGQDAAAADLVALLQGLPGVAGVDLRRFALAADPPGPMLAAFLRAPPARWDREARRIRPAQLLLLAPDGIRLSVEASP